MFTVVTDRHPTTGLGKVAYETYKAMSKISDEVKFVYLGRGEAREPYGLREALDWMFIYPKQVENLETDFIYASNRWLCTLLDSFDGVIRVSDTTRVKGWYGFHKEANFLKKKLMEKILRKYLEKIHEAEKVLVPSAYVKEDVSKTFEIPRSKIKVVLEGVNRGYFKPRDQKKCREELGLGENKKIIINVGSEENRKNITALLEIMATLQNKMDVKLIRIGEKTSRSQKIIKSEKIDVDYISEVPEETLGKYYSASDLHLVTSLEEGAPTTNLEAIASGTPSLSLDRSCMKEYMGDRLVFETKGKLLSRCESLLENQADFSQLRDHCLGLAENFTWRKTAEETLETYKSYMDG